MKYNVFVYGTLMKNMRNNYLLKNSEYIGKTEIDGYDMYDLGSYPGIIKGNGKIKGEVYSVNESTMQEIDFLENEGDLYIKVEENSPIGKVYVYVYNKSISDKNKIPYEMQPYNELIYYVAYGSNLLEERFMNYIKGGICSFNNKIYNACANTHKPLKSTKFKIPYNMYFSKESSSWNNSSVSFIDDTKPGFAYGKAYLITKEQFNHIHEQEGKGWYGKIIDLGEIDGFKAYTFTSKEKLMHKGIDTISNNYLDVIKKGLKETYIDISNEEIDNYLNICTIIKK